jgi:lipopolysaccharide export system permease protein
MTVGELKQYIGTLQREDKSYFKARMKFHEKFALPIACFALGFLAIPLGMQPNRGKRSVGTVIGISLFLLYYILLSMGWSIGESGTVPPVAGMWGPNILMTAIGIYLYRRVLLDRPMTFEGVQRLFFFLKFRSKRSVHKKGH